MAIARLEGRIPEVDVAQARNLSRLLHRLSLGGVLSRELTPESRAALSAKAIWVQFDTRIGRILLSPLSGPTGSLGVTATADGKTSAYAVAIALDGVESLITAIELALGCALTPTGVTVAKSSSARMIEVALASGETALMALDTSRIAELPPVPVRTPPAWLYQMPMFTRVAIGSSELSVDEYRTLEPGDVVIAAQSLSRPWLAVLSLAGVPPGLGPSSSAYFDIDAKTLTLLSTEQQVMESGKQSALAGAGSHSAASHGAEPQAGQFDAWQKLPVKLRFELPNIAVPLGTVAGFSPGTVVSLVESARAVNVSIFADAALVGQGELVALGDGYGVRITRLDPSIRPNQHND